MNPIQWMMPLYKEFGANHPWGSLIVVFALTGVLAGGFFGGWWYITGKVYRDQNPPVATFRHNDPPVIAEGPKEAPKGIPPSGGIVVEGGSNNRIERNEIRGFKNGIAIIDSDNTSAKENNITAPKPQK